MLPVKKIHLHTHLWYCFAQTCKYLVLCMLLQLIYVTAFTQNMPPVFSCDGRNWEFCKITLHSQHSVADNCSLWLSCWRKYCPRRSSVVNTRKLSVFCYTDCRELQPRWLRKTWFSCSGSALKRKNGKRDAKRNPKNSSQCCTLFHKTE